MGDDDVYTTQFVQQYKIKIETKVEVFIFV